MTAVDDDRSLDEPTTAIRTCPLCEAGCGLEITLDGATVGRIRGDRLDVFSHGFVCPKGSTLRQLHEDPDRVRQPLVRRGGRFEPVSWDEAWQVVAEGLGRVIDAHGREAIGTYAGNPSAHNLGALLYLRPLIKAVGSPHVYSASTVDQRPRELVSGLLYGGGLSTPVPDIDRTDLLVILGANPFVSNGSLATAPDWPGRIDAILARGGRLVVVDPTRTRTAAAATDHLAIVPGTDALFLAAIVQVLFARDLVRVGDVGEYLDGLDRIPELVAPFTPEAVAPLTGISAEVIVELAEALAGTDRAVVYGRMGTTTASFGSVTSWLIDLVNICTGHLDRPGGAMFTTPAVGAANTRGTPRIGRGVRLGRRHSRVRGLPETMGELPAVCMAEEIDTPGEGAMRALITVSGNPVLSVPDSNRLDAALATLDFLVCVDIYVNETTRHADVILPAPSALEKSHYDVALLQLAVRNVANYSPPVLERPPGCPDEWEILAKLALIVQGMGADADPAVLDDLMVQGMVDAAVADPTGPVAGRSSDELLDALAPRRGPERLLDLMVRTGVYGDGFGAVPDGLSLDVLVDHPHGIDLGPLQPRMPDVLRTPTGTVDLVPEVLVDDLVDRLRPLLDQPAERRELVLIGRRHLRSNNSWMHNVTVLVKGKPRCTLLVHPDDAAARGLADGDDAVVRSRTGTVTAPVEVSDEVRPGVVSLPHGWGHDAPGARMAVAAEHAGVNANVLADPSLFDPVSGNAVLNGIPVEVDRA